jgi:signal transduction histidine kinase
MLRGGGMAGSTRKVEPAPGKKPAGGKGADIQGERQVALLKAIVRVFRETIPCNTEEEVARVCLKAAEDLTGSSYGFIGELNQEGLFDTTMISSAGWDACGVPREEAMILLRSMPNRGFIRAGLKEGESWIINDPDSHGERVERPEGHPLISSFLGIPMRFMGGITGMIGLAKKEGIYGVRDREEMEALSTAFVETLNRRRAERRVEELNEELQRNLLKAETANRELEAFSYSVSHDLRAPLRHITGFVELLNKRELPTLDDKSRHYLQVISDAALKMGILIDDLLAFSRISRTEMMRSEVDLGRLVGDCVDELMEGEKGRDVAWENTPLPRIEGDPALFRLAILNLLSNALKFTRPRPLARIGVGAITDHPDETLFYVRDNGVGFDMKYMDKLFGLFQRLHSSEEFEGTGIGLANVKRIIDRHGGRIWAESAGGEGAVFWFTLPKERGVDLWR